MFSPMVFALVGMGLGSFLLYPLGWITGGLLGLVIGMAIQLRQRVAKLEQALESLQQATVPPSAVKVATKTPARPVDPVPAQTAPLSERLKANGITLPSEPSLPPKPKSITTPSKPSQSAAQVTPAPVVTPNPPPYQRPPRQPNLVEKAVHGAEAYLRRFFTEGNPIVRIGMLVLFFGLSFLVKYAANQGLFPLELRMSIVAAIAMVLIWLGWKTRQREGGYGLVLQGGGVAALYLTVFAAAKFYTLMPLGVALMLLLLIVVLGVILALVQNAQVLAIMATAGGFLAPILTSDGSGNHLGLFSFYLVLNLGILAIALFKTWRLLNWIGFIFTFVITSAWGVLEYTPSLYSSSQAFLLAFFALYLTVSILFSLKQPPNLKGLVDASLVFGLPIVGFGLQAALLRHTEYGLALSALVLGLIYISLAVGLWKRYPAQQRVLVESFIALGVGFATLAIPLALDAQWTSASWALEAAGLIWVGLRQERRLPRAAGYVLYLAAAGFMLMGGVHAGAVPLIRGDFMGLVLLAGAAFCVSYLAKRFTHNLHKTEAPLAQVSLVIGWLWWLVAGYIEVTQHLRAPQLYGGLIIFFSGSVAAVIGLSNRLQWAPLGALGFWLLPLVALWTLINFAISLGSPTQNHPTQGLGLIALLVYALVHYRFLWHQREQTSAEALGFWHLFSAWFLFGLIGWEASYWQAHLDWSETGKAVLAFGFIAVPLVALMALVKKTVWPFSAHSPTYHIPVPAPLLLGLVGWFWMASGFSGATAYGYLPVLNPLDITQAAVILLLVYAIKRNLMELGLMPAGIRYGLLGAFGFAWINLVVLRAIHHYTLVDYTAEALWDSVVVQMALSILWTVCALGIMMLAHQRQVRRLWMLGAALLAVVLIKLFTQDLRSSGTLAQVVSFMAVGGLMLLIGYLSPIPAAKPVTEEPAAAE